MIFASSSRLTDLTERLEKLERAFKALQFEWDDTYDKLRRAMGRIVKTHAKMAELDTEEEHTPAVGPSRDNVVPTHPGGLLTPRQKEIQQSILRRRAGGG